MEGNVNPGCFKNKKLWIADVGSENNSAFQQGLKSPFSKNNESKSEEFILLHYRLPYIV